MICARLSGRIFFFLLFFSFITLWAGQTIKYSKIQIRFQDKTQVRNLAARGLILDHVYRQKNPAGGFLYNVVLNTSEINILRASGLPFNVLIDDIQADYLQRNKKAAPTKTAALPDGFEYGSMGGYYTYSEVESELDSMRS